MRGVFFIKTKFLFLVSGFFLFFLIGIDPVSASERKLIPGVDFEPYEPVLFDSDLSTSYTGFGYYPIFESFDYVLQKDEYYKITLVPKDDQKYLLARPYFIIDRSLPHDFNDNKENLIIHDSTQMDDRIIYYIDSKNFSSELVLHLMGDARFRTYAEMEIFVISPPDETAPAFVSSVSYVFNEDNSVTYQYDLPADDDFSHLEIYQDNQLLKDDYKLNSIKISDLTPEMAYKFKFVSVDTSGNKSDPFISSVTAPSGPDLIAPLEVSEIKKVVSGTSIQFSYKLPIDNDFSHLQVWRNNVMIADNLKINSFNDNNLDYDTTYSYMFKSVDFTGNVSNGSSLSIKTMPEIDVIAPLSPVGVDVVNGNSSLFLSWSASPENDVVGYNVYIDGVKRNGSPVAGNSFRMTNLANGQEYSLQVSAVDTSGNESELTQSFVGVPDSSMLPVFKVDTDLSAVAKSTENWFSQLWLLTAFSASIPLAFVVGGRVKALFFA